MNFFPVFLAVEEAVPQSSSAALVSMLITFVPILLVFYFFIIRPQKSVKKKTRK